VKSERAILMGQIPRPCQLCWRDCSSYALSFTPFALSGSHYRYAPGIVRLALQTSQSSFSANLINNATIKYFITRS